MFEWIEDGWNNLKSSWTNFWDPIMQGAGDDSVLGRIRNANQVTAERFDKNWESTPSMSGGSESSLDEQKKFYEWLQEQHSDYVKNSMFQDVMSGLQSSGLNPILAAQYLGNMSSYSPNASLSGYSTPSQTRSNLSGSAKNYTSSISNVATSALAIAKIAMLLMV